MIFDVTNFGYDIENLDPMCVFCNTEKSDKYEEPTD